MPSDLYDRTLYSPGLHQTRGLEAHTQGMDAATSQEIQTLARITELEEKWRRDCDRLTLSQRPFKTLQVFCAAMTNSVYRLLLFILSHSLFLWVCLPLGILWLAAEFVPGPHSPYVRAADFTVEYVTWWVGLGVLSSIGLGSGLQTGVLFMFPHIIKVCLTAEACRTTRFESFSAIWFRVSETLFVCPDGLPGPPPTYFDIWKLVIIPSFLQSAGTAIGEIPPYWLTKAARLTEIKAGVRAGVPEELDTESQLGVVNRVKAWLFSFLESHGFMGVFLMASWPNFAFDLCGICCGHFLMPFWTFFGATLLGKAVVRNTYQTLFMVAIFNEKYMERLIVALQSLAPDSLGQDEAVRRIFEDVRASSHSAVAAAARGGQGAEKSGLTLSFLWGSMMSVILGFFLISCIQQFAQFYQSSLNGLESERLRSVLSTRQLRAVSASKLKRSPAADLLFSGQAGRGVQPETASAAKRSAAKLFADRIESAKAPKYDLVYLSTAPADHESDDDGHDCH